MTAPVVFRHVGKRYGSVAALDGLDLALAEDVTTAVIGPSGSGKTTLLQLINGLARPDDGAVRVFGKPIDYTRLPELRRQIGYAVQGVGLFPHLRAGANITLLARLQGWAPDRIARRRDELMGLVGLDPALASRFPHELSGGQQQRVGLCRAMMLDPRLLLLDEPFGALDPLTRADVQAEVLRLQRLGPRTIVLVTHDVREALKLARQIAVLERGRLVQHGPAEDVLNRPANDFVRDFVRAQLDV